ncbi:hypothetical protein MASR1M65_04480 [Saprospiraceae bacterium]
MRHDWILDVLRDLLSYAHRNDLPAVAAQVEQALAVAEVEIAAPDNTPADSPFPRPGRPRIEGRTGPLPRAPLVCAP